MPVFCFHVLRHFHSSVKKADGQMRLHAIFPLMPDRPHVEPIFLDA